MVLVDRLHLKASNDNALDTKTPGFVVFGILWFLLHLEASNDNALEAQPLGLRCVGNFCFFMAGAGIYEEAPNCSELLMLIIFNV